MFQKFTILRKNRTYHVLDNEFRNKCSGIRCLKRGMFKIVKKITFRKVPYSRLEFNVLGITKYEDPIKSLTSLSKFLVTLLKKNGFTMIFILVFNLT